MTERPNEEDGWSRQGEPIGSLAEEAAKLFQVLQGLSGEHLPGAAGLAEAAGAVWSDLNQHLATDGDCRYCPVCQVIAMLRQPEVHQHLASAGRSLAAALASALATQVPDEATQASPSSSADRSGGDV